jgi:hypothetical protein
MTAPVCHSAVNEQRFTDLSAAIRAMDVPKHMKRRSDSCYCGEQLITPLWNRGGLFLIENSEWGPMANEDVRLIWNPPKLGFSIGRRRSAEVTMVNGRYRRSPNLQPHEFDAVVDQQDCTGD